MSLRLEQRGGKLAKLHGAVGWRELEAAMSAQRLCGFLAWTAGLLEEPRETTPRELLAGFDWSRVAADDVALRWDGGALVRLGA